MIYVVAVRGPVPPDLALKLAKAHATALKHTKGKPTDAVNAPVGLLEVADEPGKPH
jgi:hypothetical protein